MSGTGKIALSLSSYARRCSFGLLNGDRPTVGRPTIFVFTLEELRYKELTTGAGRALAWRFFFFFGLRTLFVSLSDRRRKE